MDEFFDFPNFLYFGKLSHTNYTQIANANYSDKEFWESMLEYIKQFFHNSSKARDLFKEPNNRQLYLPDFVKLIDNIILETEKYNSKN